MADHLSEIIRPATRFWKIGDPDGSCSPVTTVMPWLICMISLTVAWTFLLGAEDIRRRLRLCYNFGISGSRSRVTGILGSLILQLAMTVATTHMLRGSPHGETSNASFGTALGAWMTRPLPAFAVSVVSQMSPSTYQTNALDIQCVELLYGLFPIYYYVDISRRAVVASKLLKVEGRPNAVAQPTITISATHSVQATRTSSPSTSTPTRSPGGFDVSPDRTCGPEKSFTCQGSSWGNCCSRFNYCGREAEYCRGGCQPNFGTCNSLKQRGDGSLRSTCGIASGASCLGSQWGDCCSQFSFCGSNETYCGEGCQREFGKCFQSATPQVPVVSPAVRDTKRFMVTMQVGALLGSVVWAFSAIVLLIGYAKSSGKKFLLGRYLGAFCVLLSLGRCASGILLWSSAINLDPQAFCPSKRAVTEVTLLWAFVPAFDHIWRILV